MKKWFNYLSIFLIATFFTFEITKIHAHYDFSKDCGDEIANHSVDQYSDVLINTSERTNEHHLLITELSSHFSLFNSVFLYTNHFFLSSHKITKEKILSIGLSRIPPPFLS